MTHIKSQRIKVGLVQIGDRFGNEYYLPYSIAVLQAYAMKYLRNPDSFHFMLPLYKRIRIEEAVERFLDTDIVFFSCYIWNYNFSLELAKRIKQENRKCLIVFGGPQVPESHKDLKRFLTSFPFVDIACYGEGEIPFVKILESISHRSWEDIPSVGFFDQDGRFVYKKPVSRIKNLDLIPSPYLEGIFDALLEAYPEERWAALLETNRGCPFSCAYCYWGGDTRRKVYRFNEERVFREIDWISKNKIEFVFCCDANFGIFERDLKIVERVVKNKIKYHYPKAFSVQNTKNSTERIFKLQKLLNDAGLQKGVNLALQSVNTDTLMSINRTNIDNSIYRALQLRFTRSRIPTFTDMIIALPLETYESFTQGVSELIKNGQHNRIQFINLMILENTEMARPEYQRKYGFITVDSEIIPHHTSILQNGIRETQKIVVGTKTMPCQDWIETKVFCWMASLLYFEKLLQIPFVLVNKIYSIDYKELIEGFIKNSHQNRIISDVITLFRKKAADTQNGKHENVPSKEWLNIWWPPDEFMFIKICLSYGLYNFYKEALVIIERVLKRGKVLFDPRLIREAIKLNMNLIKLPFCNSQDELLLNYNIPDVYRGVLEGGEIPLRKGRFLYVIERDIAPYARIEDWLQKVVWHGSKKGAYINTCRRCAMDDANMLRVPSEISG